MFELKVTVDLGEKTLALLTGGLLVNSRPAEIDRIQYPKY